MALVKTKILFVIIIQITLISASFFVLVSFENERSVFGDAINNAGKNRYFSAILMHEITEYTIIPESSSLLYVLDVFKRNMHLLEQALFENNSNIFLQIPDTLQTDFSQMQDDFRILDSEIRHDVEIGSISKSKELYFDDLLYDFIDKSDALTKNLSTYVDDTSIQILFLEISLGVINVVVVIGLFFMVIHILKKELEKQIILEKKLEHKTRLSLIGTLSSRLTHDIRNPLTVIKGTLDIMRTVDANPDKKHLEYFNRMDESVKRIAHQVNEVLDYVKDRPLKLEEKDLSTIIDSAMGSIDIPTNIQIRKTGDESKIICDAHMIIVALINLINNAIHAIGKQNGTIEINVDDQEDQVIVIVTDSGVGIPDDILPQIFDPLFTTKQEGTGLGLVSCKSIIEQHSGTISAKNNPTRFIVTLPKTNALGD